MTNRDFRNCFASNNGRDVFKFILWRLGVFSGTLNTPGEIALHNVGIEFMQMVNSGKEDDVIQLFTDSLFTIKPDKEI